MPVMATRPYLLQQIVQGAAQAAHGARHAGPELAGAQRGTPALRDGAHNVHQPLSLALRLRRAQPESQPLRCLNLHQGQAL